MSWLSDTFKRVVADVTPILQTGLQIAQPFLSGSFGQPAVQAVSPTLIPSPPPPPVQQFRPVVADGLGPGGGAGGAGITPQPASQGFKFSIKNPFVIGGIALLGLGFAFIVFK